jgi:UDP-glucuronate 4-epimerase
MNILVTGSAGFIGFHLCNILLSSRILKLNLVGIDNINDYYNKNIKYDRLKILKKKKLKKNKKYIFYRIDISNNKKLLELFRKFKFDIVINLAAQAGVRHSVKNPEDYVSSNLVGFANILEMSKKFRIKHLIYASTSSVYGENNKKNFKETDQCDHPTQFYAATKRANELMAHSYSSLFDLPTTGLRFFTVYGPWGRPDMAIFKFVKNIFLNKKIEIFNYGKHRRSFTYIDDIVEVIIRIINKIPKKNTSIKNKPCNSYAPFKIYNVGNPQQVNLLDFVRKIKKIIGIKKIKIKYLPIQSGDVRDTKASIAILKNAIRLNSFTNLDIGLKKFIFWYKWYYKINN